MGADIVILLLGGLLVLTAVVGGGFEVKEVKIPRIGGGARAISGIFGIFLIALGLQVTTSQIQSDPSPPTQLESVGQDAVTFSIRDNLGEDQVSEQVRVLIDGREVATIGINEHYPNSNVSVTVPKGGQYSYVLEAKAVFRNDQGDLYEIVGVGQGNIVAGDGKSFDLVSTITGDTWLAHMEERP